MASPTDLAVELRDLEKYLIARNALPGDADSKATVQTNMTAAFCKKIECLKHISMSSVMPMTEALSLSTLSDDVKTMIQTTIDTRLTTVASTSGPVVAQHHSPQRITSQINSFLTASDWVRLKDIRTSVQSKVQTLADRLQRLGCRYPAEQTIRWAVAVIALCMVDATGTFPTYPSIFSIVHDMKSVIDSMRAPWAFRHIVEYPITPDLLPKDVYDHAYDPDDPPVFMQVDRLSTTAEHHIPLRKSSALLRSAAGSPKGGGCDQSSAVTWQQLQQLMNGGALPAMSSVQPSITIGRVRAPVMHLSGESGHVVPPQPRLAIADSASSAGELAQLGLAPTPFAFMPRKAIAPSAEARADTSDASAPAAQPGADVADGAVLAGTVAVGSAVAARPSSQDIEQAAFAALTTRNTKRAAARTGVLKRPAAAPPAAQPVLKRPAAAVVEQSVVWTATDADRKKSHYQSKIYHRTKKDCKDAGIDLAESSIAAQSAFRAAGRLFDAQMAL
jgi:hypothetical protein